MTTTLLAISVCALCGQPLTTDDYLCAYHQRALEGSWALENRIMCDLLHRGVVPPRLCVADSTDPATHAADAA